MTDDQATRTFFRPQRNAAAGSAETTLTPGGGGGDGATEKIDPPTLTANAGGGAGSKARFFRPEGPLPPPKAAASVTVAMQSTRPYVDPSPAGEDEAATRLHMPGTKGPRPPPPEDDKPAEAQAEMEDPVVGWLVVVKGPGKGKSLPVGYGMNSIGRGTGNRIALAFGDANISRATHANIVYDSRGRRFFLQHGGGTNLTYVKDMPVLAPTPLDGGESILIGDTTLIFVPFCGPSFDWQDHQ